MLNSDENRRRILASFPKLLGDEGFKIIREPSPDYNCFAWAANHDDIFWNPLPNDKRPFIRFDGVSFNWPFGGANDSKLSTMLDIYSKFGYIECSDGELEPGFRKIALYGTEDNVTHAARQLINGKAQGMWTSKLGSWFLIQHGDAATIEGTEYGSVIRYLKSTYP